MPCFFCIAIGAAIASGLAGTAFEGLRTALGSIARDGVRQTDDTESTRRLELSVAVPDVPGKREKPGKKPDAVPVAVTVYKKHGRVRIQVLTHDVDRREAEAVQDAVAAAMGLEVVHRATDQEQHLVHEAVDHLGDASEPFAAGRTAMRDR